MPDVGIRSSRYCGLPRRCAPRNDVVHSQLSTLNSQFCILYSLVRAGEGSQDAVHIKAGIVEVRDKHQVHRGVFDAA